MSAETEKKKRTVYKAVIYSRHGPRTVELKAESRASAWEEVVARSLWPRGTEQFPDTTGIQVNESVVEIPDDAPKVAP